jgi:hypothetical protein
MAAIHFDPETHVYTTDYGTEVPSVTQRIRRAGLLGPAVQFYSAESADLGTAIHLACEHRDQGRDVAAFLRGEHGGYLTSYIKWCDVMEPVWASIETPQYSPRYQTAGTPDRVGTINGRPVVLDLKSGSGGKASWHGVQLALYSLIQDSDIPPQERRRIALYLRANGRMAQSVEFSSPYDYTQALALIANQEETPDAPDHDITPPRDTTDDDDGPPSATGTGKASD